MFTVWTWGDPKLLEEYLQPTLDDLLSPDEQHFASISEVMYEPQVGDTVLAMGTHALNQLKEVGAVPKNKSITSLRGSPIEHEGVTYFVTFDVGACNLDPAKPTEIIWDTQLAVRYMMTGSVLPEETGEYTYADDLDAVQQYVDWKFEQTGKRVDVSVDLETMGLYPWYDDKDIVSLSATVEAGVADILYFPTLGQPIKPLHGLTGDHTKLWEQINWLFNSEKISVRGANLKFDLIWIWVKWKMKCTNFRFDTMLVGTLLNENISNSLNTHAKVYTSMGGYDDIFNSIYDKGHMELVPLQPFREYAGGDSDACHRTASVLRRDLLKNPRLAHFYVKVLHPAARAFEKIERRGVVVDLKRYKELDKVLIEYIASMTEEMLLMLPAKLRAKFADKFEIQRKKEKNLFTPAILSAYFFTDDGLNLKAQMLTPITQKPSTSHEHLMMFEDHPKAGPFVVKLKDLNSALKTKQTYVDGFMKHLRPDGKFHPTYMLHRGAMYDNEDDAGTVTGRSSARDPAIQTLPKVTKWAKSLRYCYTAPEDMVVVELDYQQGELKIAACLADEPRMIAAYKEGMDLHSITAAKLNGWSLEDFMALELADPERFEEMRRNGKVGNFGLIYGMSAQGYREYARTAYGVILSAVEADQQHEAFFELYVGLLGWHASYINHAKQHGEVVSPLGRVRRLPLIHSPDRKAASHAGRQAINSPVQGALSDMCLWSIGLFEEMYPEADMLVGMTHDSVYGYCYPDMAPLWVPRMAQIMENLPLHELGWVPQLKFTVDKKVGPNFAELQKMAA